MEKISTDKAPSAVGPYSQATKFNNLVFTAGQISINPITNQLINGTIVEQTTQVLKNLKAVLEAADSSMEQALKVTVYLKNMNDYSKMNDIYETFFTNKPARSTVEVARLPKEVLVEIDVIAMVD